MFLALYQHEQLSRHRKSKQNANVSRCEQISVFVFLNMVPSGRVRRPFCGRVNQLPLTWEDLDGNYIDRSSGCVLARRWGLGILPLAQQLAPSWCQDERCLDGLAEREIFGARFLARGEAEARFSRVLEFKSVLEEATR